MLADDIRRNPGAGHQALESAQASAEGPARDEARRGGRGGRSPVPDLLFEDVQQARVRDLGALLDDPAGLTAATPLHRLTVFLTNRCNLACAYCKGAGTRRERTAVDLARFARLLDGHRGTPIRHVHLTGGEASLVRDLPAMVRAARARGVAHVSLTTNGTLPPARYLALVDAGLGELRLSLDAADPERGDRLAGRSGAWAAAVRTLAALAKARDVGAPFTLVANAVVAAATVERLPATVAFLLRFADDVKLIREVDAVSGLAGPAALRARAALEALVASRPPCALPLLRRKLATAFSAEAVGLAALARPRPGDGFRCYVPLTERTADARALYPCSVYRREGGSALGLVDDPPALQRARTVRFVARSDCLADPICRRYCLACTRAFNVRANEARA